ncbi:calcium-dependent protein [Salix suchowensis]|nr:calcium-dependent protein [Salix suchowensis]
MEEIRRAAGASYEHLREKDKKLARKNFKAMDKNRDGQISLREYMAYLKKKRATDLSPQSIFSALDKDNNGSLDFEEAFLLFYIMESGRALFCKSCKTFMPGAYFSCCQCFFKVDVKSTYEICCDCYGGKKFSHHDGATFCDNYTLLRQSRSAIQEAPSKKRSKVLKFLKMGVQIVGITTGIVSITDTSSTSNCSIM